MPYRGKNRGKDDFLPRNKLRFGAFYHDPLAANRTYWGGVDHHVHVLGHFTTKH
jgi:hypothetical protein